MKIVLDIPDDIDMQPFLDHLAECNRRNNSTVSVESFCLAILLTWLARQGVPVDAKETK